MERFLKAASEARSLRVPSGKAMDYVKSYRRFVSSHNLTDGIRMTVGILVPAFVMLYMGRLDIGIVMSVGALCVSVTDAPGPMLHRKNAMLVCMAAIFLVSLLVGYANYWEPLPGVLLVISCFCFSMLGVYGIREGAIGTAALLVLVLNFNHQFRGFAVLSNALYILAGGLWYFLFSITIHRIRPYRLIQQAMGDLMQEIADYLRARASFYKADADHQAALRQMIQHQVNIQQKQELVSDLIFKTRDIVRESRHTGRILLMIFLETNELFDKIMTSYQELGVLRKYFESSRILDDYHLLLVELAAELDEISLALKSARHSRENNDIAEQINKARKQYAILREQQLNAENIEGFINLRRILDNINDMAVRLHTLHQYTTFDRGLRKKKSQPVDEKSYVSHQEITWEKFRNNLTLSSNIFRYSIRVSVAALAGYLVSHILPVGHSYWILLTIIVILKPAYSLSKQRNKDRLIGTVCGVAAGLLVILLIKNSVALLVLMILLMAASFVFVRTHYLVSVLFMTPYVLIFFYLLQPQTFEGVLTDRIFDTAIGSFIAFVTSLAVLPDWERKTIKSAMAQIVIDNRVYFDVITRYFYPTSAPENANVQRARRDVLVSLANLSDAFNRMLSEPKSQQKDTDRIHQFVVLNHRLTSHIATLYHYYQSGLSLDEVVDVKPVVRDIDSYLDEAVVMLGKQVLRPVSTQHDALKTLYEEVNVLLERRRQELRAGELETTTKKTLSELKSIVDQFKFIHKISAELYKLSAKLQVAG